MGPAEAVLYRKPVWGLNAGGLPLQCVNLNFFLLAFVALKRVDFCESSCTAESLMADLPAVLDPELVNAPLGPEGAPVRWIFLPE